MGVERIVIRNYVPADAPHVAEVQGRCVTVCPDTGRFPAGFWNGPGFEGGKNIFCAVDDQEQLLGYAALSPIYVSPHLEARVLWMDLRVEPAREDADALKELLFWRVYVRAHEIARRLPGERAALSATYFSAGRASIEYLAGKGFSHYQTCHALRRDLEEPVPDLPAPQGVEVRAWRMDSEVEQRAYLEAYEAAFQNGSKPLEELQHFMRSEQWSVGTTFTAFAGEQVVGSVAAWYKPGSRAAGKTEAVFVVPEWRRRGLARYLLRESMLYLRERGLATAALEMDGQNAPARALYESLGYRVWKDEVSLGLLLER
jgi:ribosomal protein S18 acetylase RimI-like enzyme